MGTIVMAPKCCGRYLGQLFGRIAAGNAESYFKGYFCDKCHKGVAGTEVKVDFSDGKPIRDMTEAMLLRFRATHAKEWWVTLVRSGSNESTLIRDRVPLEGAMQTALKAAFRQPCAV